MTCKRRKGVVEKQLIKHNKKLGITSGNTRYIHQLKQKLKFEMMMMMITIAIKEKHLK